MPKQTPLFIETIRLEGGKPQGLDYHQARLERTRNAMGWQSPLLLLDHLPKSSVPYERCKWRIVYGEEIIETSITPYTARPIRHIKLVEAELDYTYKSTDRSDLEACFAQRGDADEVLIVRDGLLTDTSIANIALGDDQGQWLTPARPLLEGTIRSTLIEQGVLMPYYLTTESLSRYPYIRLFNALNPWGEITLSTSSIIS